MKLRDRKRLGFLVRQTSSWDAGAGAVEAISHYLVRDLCTRARDAVGFGSRAAVAQRPQQSCSQDAFGHLDRRLSHGLCGVAKLHYIGPPLAVPLTLAAFPIQM